MTPEVSGNSFRDMDQVDRLKVGRTAYQLRIDHGPDAYLYAARLAREADADGKPEEAAFWRAVYAALRPRSVVPPTKEEIAKMSTKELYDLFGTRYPKNSK